MYDQDYIDLEGAIIDLEVTGHGIGIVLFVAIVKRQEILHLNAKNFITKIEQTVPKFVKQ